MELPLPVVGGGRGGGGGTDLGDDHILVPKRLRNRSNFEPSLIIDKALHQLFSGLA